MGYRKKVKDSLHVFRYKCGHVLPELFKGGITQGAAAELKKAALCTVCPICKRKAEAVA